MQRLSIIIPSYNAAALLARGLRHLAAQDLPASQLEVVIVDDGSSDDTASVVDRYTSQIANLRYIHVPRGPSSGRAAARNCGLVAASGELIAFLDSGVLVSPTFARATIAYLDQHPAAVLMPYTYGLATGHSMA